MKNFLLLIFSIFISITNYAHSENTEKFSSMSLEELLKVKVRVSSTTPSELFDSPSVVTIIDRDLIKKYNFLSVAEAVRYVAGVDILQTNLDRNVATFRGIMQNYYSNKVLILINNIPSWNSIMGNGNLDRVNINNVDRIEVLKGPASVLYGTNAYSGVINIITKKAKENCVHGSLSYGYPHLVNTSICANIQYDEFFVTIQANNSKEEKNPYSKQFAPDPVFIDGETLYSNDSIIKFYEKFENQNLNINLEYGNHSLLLNYYKNTFNHAGYLLSRASAANTPFTDRGTLIGYQMSDKKLIDKVHLSLQAHFDHNSRNFGYTPDAAFESQLSSNKMGAFAKFHYHINNNSLIEFGADILKNIANDHKITNIYNDTILLKSLKDDLNILDYSFFAETKLEYSIFSLFLGSRYTVNDHFGDNLSSRITLNTKLNESNNIKINFGQSFRTPNILELYFNHPAVVGNQDLSPELSDSYEISLLSRYKRLLLQLTAYYTEYSDLIQRMKYADDQPAQYRNIADFDGLGFEAEIKYVNSKLINGFINYNYICGEESEQAYSNFRFAPKHTFSLGLNKEIGDFSISANSYIYTNTEALLEDIPAQYTIDLHFAYHHSLNDHYDINHILSLTNINNSDMLIPEYILRRENINTIPTTAFGKRIIYTLKLRIN